MKTLSVILFLVWSSLASAQTITKGLEYQPQTANPCHPNTTCGWVALSGQVQFFDGATATAKTVPTIVTSAKGDLAIWNGAAWQKLASDGVNGHVLTVDTTSATGWKVAAAAGGGTLAQTYANGTVPADSVMSLNPTAGGVKLVDTFAGLSDFLFRVANSDDSFRFLDVNPFVNGVQLMTDGITTSLAVGFVNALFGVSIAFTLDNALDVGSASASAAHVYSTVVNSNTHTLNLVGNGDQVNLSSTGLDPNVDAATTLGTIAKRFLSFAAKTGTVFYDLMGSSSAQGRSLLMRGTNLSSNYPGTGQVEYSPLVEFQESFGQTSDPESGYAQARMALQGQMPQTSGASTSGNQLAVLSDSGTGTYTKVLSVFNDGSVIPATDAGPTCGSATHRFLSVSEGNDAVGTGTTVGVQLSDNAASTSGNAKYSPMLEFVGSAFKSGTPAASQTVKIDQQLRTVQASDVARGFVDFLLNSAQTSNAYVREGSIAVDPFFFGQGIGFTSQNYNGSSTGFGLVVSNNLVQCLAVGANSSWYFDGTAFYPDDLTSALGKSNARFTTANVRSYYGVQQTVSSSGAVTINPALGDTYRFIPSGNITGITVSTGTFPDQTIKLILVQDAAGADTWPSTMTNVTFSGGTFTKTTTASAVDVYTLTYDSTSNKWREASRALNQTL